MTAVQQLYLRGTGALDPTEFNLASIPPSGPMEIKAIVFFMNKSGKTYRNGRPWSTELVHKILRDPVYQGEYRWNRNSNSTDDEDRQVIVIKCPAITSYDDFKDIQKKLEANRPVKGEIKTSHSGKYILNGLLKCSHCGGGMTSATGKSGQYRYYQCYSRARYGKTKCIGELINADRLEQVVLSAVHEDLLTAERMQEILIQIDDVEAKRATSRTQRMEVACTRFR